MDGTRSGSSPEVKVFIYLLRKLLFVSYFVLFLDYTWYLSHLGGSYLVTVFVCQLSVKDGG